MTTVEIINTRGPTPLQDAPGTGMHWRTCAIAWATTMAIARRLEMRKEPKRFCVTVSIPMTERRHEGHHRR